MRTRVSKSLTALLLTTKQHLVKMQSVSIISSSRNLCTHSLDAPWHRHYHLHAFTAPSTATCHNNKAPVQPVNFGCMIAKMLSLACLHIAKHCNLPQQRVTVELTFWALCPHSSSLLYRLPRLTTHNGSQKSELAGAADGILHQVLSYLTCDLVFPYFRSTCA